MTARRSRLGFPLRSLFVVTLVAAVATWLVQKHLAATADAREAIRAAKEQTRLEAAKLGFTITSVRAKWRVQFRHEGTHKNLVVFGTATSGDGIPRKFERSSGGRLVVSEKRR